jgi:hypothetical protein
MFIRSLCTCAAAPVLLCAVLLAACSDPAAVKIRTKAPVTTAATAAATATQKANKNLVSAVTTGKPGAPIAMKFELLRRPKVGEPLEVAVEVTPEAAGITALQVVFQGGEGLQLRSGGELSATTTTAMPAGTAIQHTVVVTPVREGIFYLSAVAVAEGAGSQARTFAIPVVVGDSAALEYAKPLLPPPAANGERITSMPAAESGSKP